MLRTLRIPAEFLKKRNKTIRLEIGDVIAPEALAHLSAEELGDHLKNTTYGLRKIK
jgi:putative hemolysin